MKENTQLEPGLPRTYRLLSWVLVGISIIQAISIYLRIGLFDIAIHPLWIFPFGNILILSLLYWPWVRKKTEKIFIPTLVVITTVSSILTTYLTSLIRSNPAVTISILVEGSRNLTIPFEIYEFSLVLASWQLIPLLFIPLIMVAWQYNFKAVMAYIAGSTVLDIIVLLSILNEGEVFILVVSIVGVMMTRTLTFLVVGFLVSRMMAAQRQQRRELQHANQQLLGYTITLEQLTTSRERNRLARELHDTLAHTLSGLAVQLGAIKALWKRDEPEAQNKLDDAISTARSGLNETRRALQSLRAEPLEDLGLGLAIKELAKSASARCGASVTLEMPELSDKLPPNISQAFYRAAQETLENIVRHSEATHITLMMTYANEVLTLQITDDGIGFNPEDIESDTYGLRGLQERAELIGGRCVIDSRPGQSTTITFSAGVNPT